MSCFFPGRIFQRWNASTLKIKQCNLVRLSPRLKRNRISDDSFPLIGFNYLSPTTKEALFNYFG